MNLEHLEAELLTTLKPFKLPDGTYILTEEMLLRLMAMAHTVGQAKGYGEAHEFAIKQIDKALEKNG